jgi:hypothetical protein
MPSRHQILQLIQSSMSDWSTYRLRSFPLTNYSFEEEPFAWHDFFLPYIWRLHSTSSPQLGWKTE